MDTEVLLRQLKVILIIASIIYFSGLFKPLFFKVVRIIVILFTYGIFYDFCKGKYLVTNITTWLIMTLILFTVERLTSKILQSKANHKETISPAISFIILVIAWPFFLNKISTLIILLYSVYIKRVPTVVPDNKRKYQNLDENHQIFADFRDVVKKISENSGNIESAMTAVAKENKFTTEQLNEYFCTAMPCLNVIFTTIDEENSQEKIDQAVKIALDNPIFENEIIIKFIEICREEFEKAANDSASKPELPTIDIDDRQNALGSIFGELDNEVLHATIPLSAGVIPFEAGARPDVYFYSQHKPGVVAVTSGLLGHDQQKSSDAGNFEMMIMTKEKELDLAAGIQNLACYSLETSINSGETMDAEFDDSMPAVIFDCYKHFDLNGVKAGVMAVIGITKEELAFKENHGGKALLDKLKENNVYPYFEIGRKSVV